MVARSLLVTMNAVYGRVAPCTRFSCWNPSPAVPYQTWEHAAYLSITRHARDTLRSREIHQQVVQSRAQQDSEQWHLFMIEDMTVDLRER
jgi:hypothetical protein